MKVSLDGGATWQESDGVRILYEDLYDPIYEDIKVDLELNVTTEGLICDIHSRSDSPSRMTLTSSETAQEIVERLCL